MRRRISYANVAATLALVFSMSGGALAASHYIINSTKQINPKVLKKLKGNTGLPGAPGTAGAPGKEGQQGKEGGGGKEGAGGKEGKPGKEGKEGKEGPAGPFPEGSAPSGITIRGNYGVLGANGANGYSGISFGYTLASGPTINYIPAGGAVPTECAGGTVEMPEAKPGNLCIFEAFHFGAAAGAFDPATNSTSTAGRTGAVVYNTSSAGAASSAEGTWAATAP
jgi:hypothetical protein